MKTNPIPDARGPKVVVAEGSGDAATGPGHLPVLAQGFIRLQDRQMVTFSPGANIDGDFNIPLRLLGGAHSEAWLLYPEKQELTGQGMRAIRGGGFILCHIDKKVSGDIAGVAEHAYRQLTDYVAAHGCPHIVKTWNYIPDINSGKGDSECYKRFCLGRAIALEPRYRAGDWPAGTGVGCDGKENLHVTVLASAQKSFAIENPRQVSAYRYPRQYGQKSPSFSRAAVVGEASNQLLFISGTASIVGHSSRHSGNVQAQINETMENWQALFKSYSALSGVVPVVDQRSLFRAYLRHASDLDICRSALTKHGISSGQTMFLQADICRQELLFEIDGVIPLS